MGLVEISDSLVSRASSIICASPCTMTTQGPFCSKTLKNFKTWAVAPQSVGRQGPVLMRPALLGWVPSGWGKYLLNVQESRSLGGLLVPHMDAVFIPKNTFLFPPGQQVCQRTTRSGGSSGSRHFVLPVF